MQAAAACGSAGRWLVQVTLLLGSQCSDEGYESWDSGKWETGIWVIKSLLMIMAKKEIERYVKKKRVLYSNIRRQIGRETDLWRKISLVGETVEFRDGRRN